MEARNFMRRWPIAMLIVATAACADQGDTDLDADIDAVPPAAETAPQPVTPVLSEADVTQVVTAINESQIAEGQLAGTKSENEQVREFAELMVTDHTRLLEEARQVSGMEPQAPSGVPATPPQDVVTSSQAGGALIQQLQQETDAAQTQLEGLTGAEFDQAYIARQVEAHQRALDLIEMQLAPAVQDPAIRQSLESAIPVIQQHLLRAQEIQTQLGSDTPASDTTGTGGTV